MKIKRVLLYMLVFIMLTGGVMGIVKALIPNMAWLSFRHLLGIVGALNDSTPAYAVIYGTVMAALEIVSAILLLAKHKNGIAFAVITLSVNTLGCIVAIALGDLLAIGSLLLRLSGIYILYLNKDTHQHNYNGKFNDPAT